MFIVKALNDLFYIKLLIYLSVSLNYHAAQDGSALH